MAGRTKLKATDVSRCQPTASAGVRPPGRELWWLLMSDGGSKRASEWTIHNERVIDDSRRAILGIADVELPDGVRFEQYVLRVPPAAIVVVLNDEDHVLMMWRHRFIIDRWVWELPGGYLDSEEDASVCAAREVEEETGWRPRRMEQLLSFQPMVGTIDQPNVVYLARGADFTGAAPDINEAEHIAW